MQSIACSSPVTVSYTHLDVYKRQETYRTEPYAQALVSVINEYKPEIMLVCATAIGRDLGPTVSARVKTGLTADCTKLEIGDFPINAMPGQEQKLSLIHI